MITSEAAPWYRFSRKDSVRRVLLTRIPATLRSVVVLGALLFGKEIAAQNRSDFSEGWHALTELRFSDGYREFEKGSNLLAQYGRALALLNLQPVTPARVEESRQLLADISRADPHGDVGLWSRFYLARIAQWHKAPTDPAEAIRLYADLIKERPEHPSSQNAIPHLAILLLYDQSENDVHRRFLRAGELEKQIRDPDSLRDYNLVLARSRQFFGIEPHLAAQHLSKAISTGRLSDQQRANALVALGETLRSSGNVSGAAASYQLFLRENPRDSRQATIQKRISDLGVK